MPRVLARLPAARPVLLAGLAIATLACTAPPPAPVATASKPVPASEPPAPAVPTPPASPLVLELGLADAARSESGRSPRFTARLHNPGSAPHKAVLSGDGSASGAREPRIWWTGEYDLGDGTWRPMIKQAMPACGMFDENWHDEIVTIAPGVTTSLGDWIGAPDYTHNINDPGKYRVQLHYAYTAGRVAPDGFVPGDMAGVPAFELTSAPVEFTVFRPLELISRTRPAEAAPRRLSDVLTLEIVSASAEDKQLPSLASAELLLLPAEVGGDAKALKMKVERTPRGVYIPAGGRLDVNRLADLAWSPALAVPGARVQVRLRFVSNYKQWGPDLELLSDPLVLTP